jgi:hypothetical protein
MGLAWLASVLDKCWVERCFEKLGQRGRGTEASRAVIDS